MIFLAGSGQADQQFCGQTDHCVGCGVNWRNPPEMKRKIPSSKNQRTASIGKRLNNRLSHTREDLFRRRQKRIDYPARRHHKANACPNRNSTFHAGTPPVFSPIISLTHALTTTDDSHRLYWFFFFSACRSSPSSISRPISSGYSTPEAAHNFGYMLIEVKPGMVLISFK